MKLSGQRINDGPVLNATGYHLGFNITIETYVNMSHWWRHK